MNEPMWEHHVQCRMMWIRRIGVAVVMVSCLTAPASAANPVPLNGLTRDPELARLFTPAAAPAGAYDIFRSTRAIAELAAELRRQDPSPRADAWRVLRGDPVTAFGSEGRYDRARLARLFVGRQLRVARGALIVNGELSSYTLITPIPDPTLTALQDATMVIVTHVGRLTDAGER
jgi:hypothetical protein